MDRGVIKGRCIIVVKPTSAKVSPREQISQSSTPTTLGYCVRKSLLSQKYTYSKSCKSSAHHIHDNSGETSNHTHKNY